MQKYANCFVKANVHWRTQAHSATLINWWSGGWAWWAFKASWPASLSCPMNCKHLSQIERYQIASLVKVLWEWDLPLIYIAFQELGWVNTKATDEAKRHAHAICVALFLILGHIAMIAGMLDPSLLGYVPNGMSEVHNHWEREVWIWCFSTDTISFFLFQEICMD